MLQLGVTSCVKGGAGVNCEGVAIRLTNEEINALSDRSVEDILNANETGYRKGCYVPNRQ